MKFTSSLFFFTFTVIAGFTLQASAAPTSEWMDHGSTKPDTNPNNCPNPKAIRITNQNGPDFYKDHCHNSMCVGNKGLSYLNSTTFTGACDQKDVYCAAVYDAVKVDDVITDESSTVSYPKGHLLCSLPTSTTSTFTCANGASVEVTVRDSSYTYTKFKSTEKAVISGYFKSWRDEKGCAITSRKAYSHMGTDVFYPACGVNAGETVCEKK